MAQTAILLPVYGQVFLTFAILISMGSARAGSLRAARKNMNDATVALGTFAWSDEATKRANSFRNQFELPVLFYAVVAFAVLTRQADVWMTGLAWGFVVSRIAHAAIHIGPNVVAWRFAVYLAGATLLLVMWVLLAMRTIAFAG